MKNFFGEFKKFIMRGNVVDMSVGVIVGGAFTGIVNGMSNFILKPITNAVLTLILGKDSLSELYTVLVPEYQKNEAGQIIYDAITKEPLIDLANSIYIDWGSFINAVINFFLIAIVLFIIVKFINKIKEEHKEITDNFRKKKLTKEQRKELKANGIKRRNRKAVEAYFAEKQRLADEEAAKAAQLAEEAAAAERAANPTAEDLLKEIRDLLKKG